MSHFFVFFSSFYIHIFIDIDSRCLSWMLFLLLFHHFTKLFCRAALEISRIGSYASKSQTYRLTAKRYAWKIRELIIDIFNEVFVAASANGIHHIQYARFSKTWKCHMFAARCGLICWNFFFFKIFTSKLEEIGLVVSLYCGYFFGETQKWCACVSEPICFVSVQ